MDKEKLKEIYQRAHVYILYKHKTFICPAVEAAAERIYESDEVSIYNVRVDLEDRLREAVTKNPELWDHDSEMYAEAQQCVSNDDYIHSTAFWGSTHADREMRVEFLQTVINDLKT